jgi:imidazolonepropionase-like amidohydrolase
VIAAARELGMMVVPEGGSLFEHNMTMVVDGHTGVEHSIPVQHIYQDVLQLWSQSQSGYTPTLIVGYGGIMGELWWYAHTQVWDNPRLARFVPREVLDRRSRRRPIAPDEEYNHIELARIARELYRAGVSVQLGAHGQREGLGAHWELAMLVAGGMTPHEALRCGTLLGARYLGLDHDLGSLEVGKLADLVVCDANPCTDIRRLGSISHVMLNGRLYNAYTLDQEGLAPQKRGRFFFEP